MTGSGGRNCHVRQTQEDKGARCWLTGPYGLEGSFDRLSGGESVPGPRHIGETRAPLSLEQVLQSQLDLTHRDSRIGNGAEIGRGNGQIRLSPHRMV
jgi:hypothetical protein